jgi:hypothetical protein
MQLLDVLAGEEPRPTIALCYLRRASSGDRRDAFHAGYTPAAILKSNERSHTLRRSPGTKMGAK